ncbi:MAG: hypothetical protein OXH52_15345 [Gammaproteobacteria bacterium]|nr:hypothetical protein [Gammaproteobacteria bacterium]
MNAVRVDARRRRLALSCCWPPTSRGRPGVGPIHGRIESEHGGAGEPTPSLKLGAVGNAPARAEEGTGQRLGP